MGGIHIQELALAVADQLSLGGVLALLTGKSALLPVIEARARERRLKTLDDQAINLLRVPLRFGGRVSASHFSVGNRWRKTGKTSAKASSETPAPQVKERAGHCVAEVMPQVEQRHQNFVQRRHLAWASIIIQVRTLPLRSRQAPSHQWLAGVRHYPGKDASDQGASGRSARRRSNSGKTRKRISARNRRMETKQSLDLGCTETVKVLEPVEV